MNEESRSWSRRLVRWYGLYAAALIAYWGAALLAGLTPVIGTSVSSVIGLRIIPDLCAAYLVGRLLVVRERTFKGLGTALRRDLLRRETAERLAGIALFVLGTVFMFDVFGAVKEAIPELGAYVWDAPLARLDSALHGGRDPWRWSHAVPFGGPLTRFIDRVYVSWYGVLILCILLAATWAPLRLRARFFVALVLSCALAGSLLATVLASGGPVYFAEFTGDADRFRPLLQALEGTRARDGQLALWEAFATRSEKLYGGISAMPSMHVALSALVAMAAWAWNGWLGVVAAIYGALILVGSVHLGWHYAVDGYVGILAATVIWMAAGFLVAEDEPSPGRGQKPALHMGLRGPASRSEESSGLDASTTPPTSSYTIVHRVPKSSAHARSGTTM